MYEIITIFNLLTLYSEEYAGCGAVKYFANPDREAQKLRIRADPEHDKYTFQN
jgi:hypothetical protein